ncbi:MAG: hypothetical protein EXR43_03585 [Dehalococcoidia bacterium]|nr:hypothetical protein [Dehalococcoidia bacterium]
MMDNDYGLDISEIIRTINSADVMTFRFLIISQRLLIDMRTNDLDGPLLTLVPRATSVEERFRSVKQLRPRFKTPENIISVWWPRYARGLSTSGVWEAILHRIVDLGFPEVAERAAEVLKEVCTLEHAEVRNAISGKGYHTIWEYRG